MMESFCALKSIGCGKQSASWSNRGKKTIEEKMKKEFPRFDMKKPPVRTKWFLQPLEWILSMPDVILHRTRIQKFRTEGLKPPYLLLCNHNAFMDFKVATKAIFPYRRS